MEEKVIKRSPKKIIWNALFGLTSVLFFLLPLSYLHLYSQKGTRLHTISLLLILLVLFCAGVVVYQTYRLLSSDKEYLSCTVEGFYYKPNPKKPSRFYAWTDVEEFSFSRIRGKYRDSYRIEVYFKKQGKCEIPILSSSAEEKDSPFSFVSRFDHPDLSIRCRSS